MSYQLYDANGYVADLATGKGLNELLVFLRQQKSPAIKELATELSVPATPEALKAIEELPEPNQATLASTLRGLKANAKKCDEVIIIGDGVNEGVD